MTTTEKIIMFKEKKGFIENISKVFKDYSPRGSTVEKIEYRVFYNKNNDFRYFSEWIIVTYIGGGKSCLSVNGNSNTANFRAIGTVLDNGHYDDVMFFESLEDKGYEEIEL